MHSISFHRWAAIAFAGLIVPLLTHAQDRANDLAIIVNKATTYDGVSLADLQHYFKVEKSKGPDGAKIVLAMQEPGRPERAAALQHIYNMSESQYADFFVEATFTGAVSAPPRAFGSPAAVKKFVADTAGAIGYVRATDVDDSVKELKVDGKSPGGAGYPIPLK